MLLRLPHHIFALQKDNFDYRWNTVDNVLLQHNGPQTASGAAIVVPQSIVIEENSVKMKNSKENNSSEKIPVITEVCIGKITDMGIKDANNMGAAMAPAAAQTILDFLRIPIQNLLIMI